MPQLIETDNVDTLPEDLYWHCIENMPSEDIKIWLQQITEVSAAHMNSCGLDPDNMDEVDESFLMYENAFLFLYGLAKANDLFKQDKDLS